MDLFWPVVLLFICWKLTYSVMNVTDLMFADETNYIIRGFQLNAHRLFIDGSVYYVWIKFWSMFIGDPLTLYCVNFGILVSINPFLFYLLGRRFGFAPFRCGMLALFFLVSTLNVFTWPFITRFVVMLILLTVLGVTAVKNEIPRFMVVLAGMVLLVYTRPEFILSLYLFVAVAAFIFLRRLLRNADGKRKHLLVIGAVVLPVVFATWIKSPVQQGRSVVAFAQHYGANLRERQPLDYDPWMKWRRVMTENFNTDESLLKAFINNPGEVVNHVVFNVKKFPKKFFYQLFPYNSARAGTLGKQIIKWMIILMFTALFFNLLRFLRRGINEGRETGKPWFRTLFNGFGAEDLFLHGIVLLIAAPLLISLFLIHPRTHYLVILLGLTLMMLIRHLPLVRLFSVSVDERIREYGNETGNETGTESKNGRENRDGNRATAVFAARYAQMTRIVVIISIGALCYWLPWKASWAAGFLPGEPLAALTYVNRTLAVKNIPPHGEVRLLSVFLNESFQDALLQFYLETGNNRSFTVFRPGTAVETGSFLDYLSTNNINMIYVDKNLLKHHALKDDVSFQRFIDSPPCHWVRHPVPGGDEYILARQ